MSIRVASAMAAGAENPGMLILLTSSTKVRFSRTRYLPVPTLVGKLRRFIPLKRRISIFKMITYMLESHTTRNVGAATRTSETKAGNRNVARRSPAESLEIRQVSCLS